MRRSPLPKRWASALTIVTALCLEGRAGAAGIGEAGQAVSVASPLPAELEEIQATRSFCERLDPLLKASQSDFKTVRTVKIPDAPPYYESSLNLPDTVDSCRIFDGLMGSFIACNLGLPVPMSEARARFQTLQSRVSACIPTDWLSRTETSSQLDRHEWQRAGMGFVPNIVLMMRERTRELYYVQIRIQTRLATRPGLADPAPARAPASRTEQGALQVSPSSPRPE